MFDDIIKQKKKTKFENPKKESIIEIEMETIDVFTGKRTKKKVPVAKSIDG